MFHHTFRILYKLIWLLSVNKVHVFILKKKKKKKNDDICFGHASLSSTLSAILSSSVF